MACRSSLLEKRTEIVFVYGEEAFPGVKKSPLSPTVDPQIGDYFSDFSY